MVCLKDSETTHQILSSKDAPIPTRPHQTNGGAGTGVMGVKTPVDFQQRVSDTHPEMIQSWSIHKKYNL